MKVSLAAQGRFLTLQYRWADEGKPQDGLMLVGSEPDSDEATAVWIDSWHMNHKHMVLKGAYQEDDAVSVLGSYAAPPGPDWGWRIVVQPVDDSNFRMLNYNIPPDVGEVLAVEVNYVRDA